MSSLALSAYTMPLLRAVRLLLLSSCYRSNNRGSAMDGVIDVGVTGLYLDGTEVELNNTTS